jgi:hypothetical protein
MNQKYKITFLMKNGINNMFDSKHYVPILKWKRAEQGALEALSMEDKKYITPLIQMVMPKQKDPQAQLEDFIIKFEEQIPQIPEKIMKIWGSTPIFVDFSLLFTNELKIKSVKSIFATGKKLGATLIPVIHLNDDPDLKKVVYSLAKENKSGMCLRLICPDFSDLQKLNQDIANFLSVSGLTEKDVDLLVDIKETAENTDKFIKYFELSQKIPNLLKWRTFIFASGTFPKDLSGCKHDEENFIPRLDWKNWKDQVVSNNLTRKPSFSDYTIQYPIYNDSVQFFHPTASIKYTLENEWLIMKGQRQKFEQYLANAELLVRDNQKFYGKDFSFGDKYIAEKANHFAVYIKNRAIKGTGSTETWLKAGINHHFVLVAHQVASLP